ncbi:MAG TPA: hypothetical protein VM409_06565, partial [Chloroflexia bacterium]|nr:hypothetical protein [Chloroflexia bacterium]
MQTIKGQSVNGRYLLEGKSSGSGAVESFNAVDAQLQRQVTLLVLSEAGGRDPRTFTRFKNLQKVAPSIQHPNVVEVYDVGEWDKRPYLVLERDTGIPASSLYRGPAAAVDLAAALRVLRQAAGAVQSCRKAGLLDWGFSYKSVCISPGANAQVTLAQHIDLEPRRGQFVSYSEWGDAQALGGLFRAMLTGSPDGEPVSMASQGLPGSIQMLLDRLQPGAHGRFGNAAEVAEAVAAIEALSSDYTQAYDPAAPSPGNEAAPAVQPRLDRTESFAEAPTLAVNRAEQAGAVALPMPYLPAEDVRPGDNMASVAPVRAPATNPARETRDRSLESGRRRRQAPVLAVALVAGLLLLGLVAMLWPKGGTIAGEAAAGATATASQAPANSQ